LVETETGGFGDTPAPSLEHAARKAWRALYPESIEPLDVEAVQTPTRGKRTTVYRLKGVGPQGSAVIAKRSRASKAMLERITYEEVLPHFPGPTLRYYGCAQEEDGDFSWLFLEDAGGEPYSSHIDEHRLIAARWLGLLHLTAAGLNVQALLPHRGTGFYLGELRSARATILENLGNPVLDPADLSVLRAIISHYDVLESQWGQVDALCGEMPQTVVHGHVETRNLRVRTTDSGSVLLVFDWETASWGTPAIDLAQLIFDSVSPPVVAYLSGAGPLWPRLDARDVHRLAHIGGLFRTILDISSETYGLVYEKWASQGPEFARNYARWCMHDLRTYGTALDQGIVTLLS